MDAQPKQIEAGTAVHLAFDELQSIDLSFDLTVAPMHLQCRQHCGLITDEVGGEAGQRGPLGRSKPAEMGYGNDSIQNGVLLENGQ